MKQFFPFNEHQVLAVAKIKVESLDESDEDSWKSTHAMQERCDAVRARIAEYALGEEATEADYYHADSIWEAFQIAVESVYCALLEASDVDRSDASPTPLPQNDNWNSKSD